MSKSDFGDANKEKHKLQWAINRKGDHKFHKENYNKIKTNSKEFFTYIRKKVSWKESRGSLGH